MTQQVNLNSLENHLRLVVNLYNAAYGQSVLLESSAATIDKLLVIKPCGINNEQASANTTYFTGLLSKCFVSLIKSNGTESIKVPMSPEKASQLLTNLQGSMHGIIWDLGPKVALSEQASEFTYIPFIRKQVLLQGIWDSYSSHPNKLCPRSAKASKPLASAIMALREALKNAPDKDSRLTQNDVQQFLCEKGMNPNTFLDNDAEYLKPLQKIREWKGVKGKERSSIQGQSKDL